MPLGAGAALFWATRLCALPRWHPSGPARAAATSDPRPLTEGLTAIRRPLTSRAGCGFCSGARPCGSTPARACVRACARARAYNPGVRGWGWGRSGNTLGQTRINEAKKLPIPAIYLLSLPPSHFPGTSSPVKWWHVSFASISREAGLREGQPFVLLPQPRPCRDEAQLKAAKCPEGLSLGAHTPSPWPRPSPAVGLGQVTPSL